MAKFEMSPEKFTEEYIYNEKGRVSKNMAYGSMMADGLESGEASGDPLLDLMMAKLPKFEVMDQPIIDPKGTEVLFERKGEQRLIKIPTLENKGDDIPILAIPDTMTKDYSAIKEYKTSVKRWTQKKADDSGQLTFYATAIWLTTGKIPKDIELVNVETDYEEDGRLTVTGNMYYFQTKREMIDIIKMCSRIRHVWSGIKNLTEKELLYCDSIE